VKECIELTKQKSIQNLSFKIFKGGAIQFVVQEAFDKTLSSILTSSSFAQITIVLVSSFIGADTKTLDAQAKICLSAISIVLAFHVLSKTKSIHISFHGRSDAFLIDKFFTLNQPVIISSQSI